MTIQGPRERCSICNGRGLANNVRINSFGYKVADICVLCDGEGTTNVYPPHNCETDGHSFGHGYFCHYCGFEEEDE